jgi:SulP family sulfate permease
MRAAPTSPPSALATFYRVVPAFESLRGYRFTDARADLVAGLTVAAVAVPQAMAYGIVAGVPAQYGLYTAIVMTAVGAVFDSSRQLINGPTNATSIAVLSATAFVAADQKLEAVVLLGLLIGLIQLGITFLRLGDLTRYISHSVIIGFTAGAGTLLVLDQLKHLVGLKAMGDAHDHFLVRLYETLMHGGPVHLPTAAVGIGSALAVVGLRWLKGRLGWTLFPELLVVVVGAALVTRFAGLADLGVKVVGDVPANLPPFKLPTFDLGMAEALGTSAFAIALLGLLEALAMAKAIAAHTGQRLDLNQQCMSEGLANFTGSLFQCIPGSGSLTRSAINQQAGARTQWSGVWSAGAVALIMLLFAPWAQYIPRAALSGLLIPTAWRMVDRKALAYALKATRYDGIIVLATAVSAVAVSVEFCILIGVFLSFALAVPRAGRMQLTEFVVGSEGFVHERLPEDEPCPRILIFGLEGEMFFGAGPTLEQHLDAIEARVTADTKVLVLRLKRVRSPDAVGAHMMDGFVRRLATRGVHVLLCGVRKDLAGVFARTGLLDVIPPEHLFREQKVRQTSTALAIQHAYTLIEAPCAHCPHVAARAASGGNARLGHYVE